MSRARGDSGYADGLISRAAWRVVAVLLDQVAAQMPVPGRLGAGGRGGYVRRTAKWRAAQ